MNKMFTSKKKLASLAFAATLFSGVAGVASADMVVGTAGAEGYGPAGNSGFFGEVDLGVAFYSPKVEIGAQSIQSSTLFAATTFDTNTPFGVSGMPCSATGSNKCGGSAAVLGSNYNTIRVTTPATTTIAAAGDEISLTIAGGTLSGAIDVGSRDEKGINNNLKLTGYSIDEVTAVTVDGTALAATAYKYTSGTQTLTIKMPAAIQNASSNIVITTKGGKYKFSNGTAGGQPLVLTTNGTNSYFAVEAGNGGLSKFAKVPVTPHSFTNFAWNVMLGYKPVECAGVGLTIGTYGGKRAFGMNGAVAQKNNNNDGNNGADTTTAAVTGGSTKFFTTRFMTSAFYDASLTQDFKVRLGLGIGGSLVNAKYTIGAVRLDGLTGAKSLPANSEIANAIGLPLGVTDTTAVLVTPTALDAEDTNKTSSGTAATGIAESKTIGGFNYEGYVNFMYDISKDVYVGLKYLISNQPATVTEPQRVNFTYSGVAAPNAPIATSTSNVYFKSHASILQMVMLNVGFKF